MSTNMLDWYIFNT